MQIAIIGLGLIGGSLAKALKENTEHTVIGFDRDENTLLDALSLGAIDSVGSTSLLENADVVYVCLYPADVVRFVEENAPHFKEGCIVTDVCGIKNQVCGKLTEIAKNYPFVYVGGHPMAGKERSGFDASEASLFYNRYPRVARKKHGLWHHQILHAAKARSYDRLYVPDSARFGVRLCHEPALR